MNSSIASQLNSTAAQTEGWQEQMIAVEGDQLHFILGTATSEDVFSKTNDIPNGDMLEISPPSCRLCLCHW
jgi:hypothetical protein